MLTWALVTGSYPPAPGGVADYTRVLAGALAEAGDRVHVLAPVAGAPPAADPGVRVHTVRGFGRRGRADLAAVLDRLPADRRILLQYVPQAFGHRGMNLPLCLWLSRRPEPLIVMFHEIVFPLVRGQPARHRVLALVSRWMATILARRADRTLVSTPAWVPHLQRAAPASRAEWAPVPSNLPVTADPAAVAAVRAGAGVGPEQPLIGHFGTYAPALVAPLGPVLLDLLRRDPSRRVLLLGRGSREFAADLRDRHPAVDGAIHATGACPAERVAAALAACDLVLQPYPDGVTTRRGSVMAALALGRPVVTNAGPLSEALWADSDAVRLAGSEAAGSMVAVAEELLGDPAARAALGRAAGALYAERFSVERTVRLLRGRGLADEAPAQGAGALLQARDG